MDYNNKNNSGKKFIPMDYNPKKQLRKEFIYMNHNSKKHLRKEPISMDYNSKKNNNTQDAFGHVMMKIMRDKNISGTAKLIYSYLCAFANSKTGECYPSLSTILEELNISKNTFYRYIKELEDKKIIERKQHKNRPTIYKLLNHEIQKVTKFGHRTIDNNITNDINISIEPSESEKYLAQNKYFTYRQKKAILKTAKGNIQKAREIERHIFGAKKTAIKNKTIDFKHIPLIAWINKISKYLSKANNKTKYLFNALTNEFKEYFNAETIVDTNKTYRNKAKKVIRPEWEEVEKKEIEEATEEEKEELLQKLADLRAGNYKTKEKEEKITEIEEDKNAKEKWLSKLEQLRCKNTPLKFS